MVKVRHCGVSCGVVLSCMVLYSWARYLLLHGDVLFSRVGRGVILALLGLVKSCPVRLCVAWFFEVWICMVPWSPVLLGQVQFGSATRGKVRRYRGLARSGCVGRSIVGRCFVWSGKVISWSGEVLFGVAGFDGVLHCIVSYAFIVALFGPVFHREVSHAKVVLRRGVVWSVDVLHGVVKFCPVKYSVAGLGVIWYGDVTRGAVWNGAAKQAKALFWQGGAVQCEVQHARVSFWRGTAGFGFARLRAVGQAWLWHHLGFAWSGEAGRSIVRRAEALLRRGQVWLGTVLSGQVWFSSVFFGKVQLGLVRQCPVRLSPAKCCTARHAQVLLRSGIVKQGRVRRGAVRCSTLSSGHGYGGYQK